MARVGCVDQALRRVSEGLDPEEELEYEQDRRVQEQILPLLNQLPPREADMVQLYFIAHKRQQDIADLFGVSQAAISYSLSRAMQRLRFLIQAPKLTEEEITALLAPHFETIDMSILLSYRQTASQSETAKSLNLSQGRVRHRLYKAVARLEKLNQADPTLNAVTRLFVLLRDSHNILNSVILPQWQRPDVKRDDRFR